MAKTKDQTPLIRCEGLHVYFAIRENKNIELVAAYGNETLTICPIEKEELPRLREDIETGLKFVQGLH